MSNQTKPNLWWANLGLCVTLLLPGVVFSANAPAALPAQQSHIVLDQSGRTIVDFSAKTSGDFLTWLAGLAPYSDRFAIDYPFAIAPALRFIKRHFDKLFTLADIYSDPDAQGFLICLAARLRNVNQIRMGAVDGDLAVAAENCNVSLETETAAGETTSRWSGWNANPTGFNGFEGTDNKGRDILRATLSYEKIDAMWAQIAALIDAQHSTAAV